MALQCGQPHPRPFLLIQDRWQSSANPEPQPGPLSGELGSRARGRVLAGQRPFASQMIVVGGSSGGDRRVLLHTAREWCAKSLTGRPSVHLVTRRAPDRSPMKDRVSRSSTPARATAVDPTPISRRRTGNRAPAPERGHTQRRANRRRAPSLRQGSEAHTARSWQRSP